MKRLLTISVFSLLLISCGQPEVPLTGKYCYISDGRADLLVSKIEEQCKKGDVLMASLFKGDSILGDSIGSNYNQEKKKNVMYAMTYWSTWWCDFNREIYVREDEIGTYLQCVISDEGYGRTDRSGFKFDSYERLEGGS